MASMKLIYLSNQTFIFSQFYAVVGVYKVCSNAWVCAACQSHFYLSSSTMLPEVGIRSAARSSDPSAPLWTQRCCPTVTSREGDLPGGSRRGRWTSSCSGAFPQWTLCAAATVWAERSCSASGPSAGPPSRPSGTTTCCGALLSATRLRRTCGGGDAERQHGREGGATAQRAGD